MTRKIAIFNMKGGVGKSTTAYNLAAGLSKFHGQRVLLVDLDPQGHSSVSLGIPIWTLEKQIKDVLTERIPIQEAIVTTDSHIDVVPSNVLLAEEEIPISGLPGRELLFRKALAPIASQYDVIIIDCPPNVGVFSINALMASDQVIVPVDMSYLGLLGISGIERTLNLIQNRLDHPIEMAGVLATRFDSRNNLSKVVLQKLQDHFGNLTFETVIPETVKLREAPSHSKSIFDYDPNGAGARTYKELAEEVMK